MKNPLLTHFIGLVRDRSLRSFMATLVLTVMMAYTAHAQVVTASECYCLNNSTTSGNGQYLDTIIIQGTPGQAWRLLTTSSSAFYHPGSLPPPSVPILYLNNTTIPETVPGISGVYRIVGKRVSGVAWTVSLRNMNTNQVIPLSSAQTCSYPSFVITGDEDVCRNSVEMYSIPGTGIYTNLSWMINGGFTSVAPVLPATGSNAISVTWGPTPGRYTMGVSGMERSFNLQSLGCSFNLVRPIDVEDISEFTKIRGDFGNCIGSTEIYKIDAPIGQLSDPITWKIDNISGAPFASTVVQNGPNRNQRIITWPSSIGEYNLIVSGSFTILNGAGAADDNICAFADTMRIKIVNEATPSLACKSLVNLSMNPSCELYFTASQFLEGQIFSDTSYDIIIKDISTNTIIPAGTLGYGYIGKTLEIRVVHECSGNSCWGYAKVEDKAIPELICPPDRTINCEHVNNLDSTGYPLMPINIIKVPIVGEPNTWKVTGFDRCSDVILSYTETSVQTCDTAISTTIMRTWKVVDISGNSSTCVQKIYVRAASIRDVIFPPNWDDVTGPNPSLAACGPWPMIPYILNGKEQLDSVPNPDYTGRPLGIQCLKAHVTYSDRKIYLCNNNVKTYKLFRKWNVLDHCTGRDTAYTQLIAVMDNTPPAITCPADITGQPGNGTITPAAIVTTKPFSCIADWVVLPPVSIFDCTATTWKVEFLLANSLGQPPVNGNYTDKVGSVQVTGTFPNFTIINLPTGRTWVRYTVTDACGNFSYCFTEIDVVDNQPPVPVCDRNSIVALTDDGTALVGVLTFDDGSHDNCGIVCMKVRRMDNLVSWDNLPCDNKISFNCNDLGPNKRIMVELGVWDKAGNFNSCMVEAQVQDNIFPKLNVPQDGNATCTESFSDLSRFGLITATDNCTVRIDSTRKDSLNECGIGIIRRVFTATDSYGNKVIKTHTIYVGNTNPIVDSDINWGQQTVQVTNRCVSDLSPEALGIPRPSLFSSANAKCSKMAYNYEDTEFGFGDGFCKKILRRWTAIDWCQKTESSPRGEFYFTQMIVVNNTVAPVITNGCLPAHLKMTTEGVCQARVEVTATATETLPGDCPSKKLGWSYDIDFNNDNVVDLKNQSGATINRLFDYGTHKITWYVSDDCGNIGTCANVFTVSDQKKPTPVCITELVTVIMPVSREISIWASDFNKGSFDNCSTGSQLTASFSATNRNDISRVIRCSDLAGAISKEFAFNVYTIDAAGNSDFCTVRLLVQSNGNSCASLPATLGLKGTIYSESEEMVQNVNVELSSDQIEFPKSVMTGYNGKWSTEGLKAGMDYAVYPGKNDDPMNGITTLDLVMIQRHILGLTELDSPYKLIAADVNGSQKITAADLVELRKLILGIQTSFANNRSWRFIDGAYQFIDVKNPFPFTEKIHMTKASQDMSGLDFVAVKVGDVNGSAKKNINSDIETSVRSVTALENELVTARKGDIVKVALKADEISNLAGLQMTLGIDNSAAELVSVTSDVLNLKDENLGLRNLSEGLVHVSWTSTNIIHAKDQLLTVTLRMLKDAKDQQLVKLESAYLKPELYIKEEASIVTYGISLKVTGATNLLDDQFEIYQNVPNPFNASTVIGFNIPKADDVTLKLYDITGKMVHNSKAHFNKGYNTFTVDANALNLNGVLYYQIETDTHSATRKMIIIK